MKFNSRGIYIVKAHNLIATKYYSFALLRQLLKFKELLQALLPCSGTVPTFLCENVISIAIKIVITGPGLTSDFSKAKLYVSWGNLVKIAST